MKRKSSYILRFCGCFARYESTAVGCSPKFTYVLLFLNIIFLLIGLSALVCIFCFDFIVKWKIGEEIKLKEDTLAYASWLSPGPLTKFSIYMYNITNPNEILHGQRPRLQEVGPYVYWEISAKENVTPVTFGARSSLSYMKRTTYTFDRSLSVGDPSTAEIISLSLSTLALLESTKTARGVSLALVQFLNLLLDFSPFAKMSFSEHVWGHTDDLLALCHAFTPETCKTDKLGLLLNVNNSLVGPYVVDSGLKNNSYIGQILSYKNHSSFNIWSSAEANLIQGTDGTRFAPDIHLNSTFNIFVPTLCRSFLMEAFRETTPSNFQHLRVLEMRPHQSNYEAAEKNLRNAGFCALDPSGPQCPPQGLFSIASCKAPGAIKPPLFASLPHFLYADRRLQLALDGIRPDNPRYDEIRLLVEPKSGLVVEGHSRLQINAFVEKSSALGKLFGDLKEPIFLPIVWFDATTVADRKILALLHEHLYEVPTRILRILICLCVFSFIVCLTLTATIRSAPLCICWPFLRSALGSKVKPDHGSGMKETTSSRQLLDAQEDPQSENTSMDPSDQRLPSPWGGHILTYAQNKMV
uniref:Lysosome membrane protein 2 n=2 Tax=Schistocephalus solidus TaxID=70667 RepID=A0A0X3NZI9_SCHSO